MTAWKSSPQFNSLRAVLIVSQDARMSAAWEFLFRQRGYTVLHEKTPRHALQAARLTAPALTIVDMELSKAERLLLCERLRSATEGALFLLSRASESESAEFYLAGVNECLSSAISPSALIARSIAWLS